MTHAPEPHEIAAVTETVEAVAEGETAKPSNLAVEFGPILVFVILYNYLRRDDPDGAIYTAAAVFAVVAVLALLWSRLKLGKIPGMLLLTTAIIVVSVGMAYFFDDPRFIYMKPTVVNALFGLGLFGGLAFGKNVAKIMFGGAIEMREDGWRKLTVRWGLFFFAMAALNEVVWRTQSEAFWANFKLFGFMPLSLLFAVAQAPLVMRYGKVRE